MIESVNTNDVKEFIESEFQDVKVEYGDDYSYVVVYFIKHPMLKNDNIFKFEEDEVYTLIDSIREEFDCDCEYSGIYSINGIVSVDLIIF